MFWLRRGSPYSLFACALAVQLMGCEGEIVSPGGISGACLTPAPKVRRLTRAQLDATLTDALGATVDLSDSLPAEDLELGYFDHDSLIVSTLFADQLDAATTSFSAATTAAPPAALKCKSGESATDCARRVITAFAEKAWRRPVGSGEVDDLMALYTAGADGESAATGLALALQGVMEATGTLYRTELGDPGASGANVQLSQWEIASELSYLAVGGPPDDALRQEAMNGTLSDAKVRVAQLQRLLATAPAVSQLGAFVEQWLGLTNISSTQKNNQFFPKWTTALRDDVAASARAFTAAVISNSNASVPELLSADYTLADNKLATFLGSTLTPGSALAHMDTTGLPRRGLLTHPALLSTFAHQDDGSPVLRGKLVRTRLLCEDIPPPPPNVIASVAPVSGTETTRQRAEAHTSNSTCLTCHKLMDPIGFGLEAFDGIGEARTREADQAIDDSGDIEGSDVAGFFTGGVALATKLASSTQVGECASKQLARFAMGRIETSADTCTIDATIAKYKTGNGSLNTALEGFVSSDAFVSRTVTP